MYDKDKVNLSSIQYGFAGATSGAITRFLCQPFDVLKIRFQLQVEPVRKHSLKSKYRALFQAVKAITAEESLVGLWKGHNSGQLLSMSYGLIQFQTFEGLKKVCDEHLNVDSKSLGVEFVCGSLSGAAATIGSFPFDVVRTRFIAQGNNKIYFSIYNALTIMRKTEGILSYYKGLTPSLILIAPQTGVLFASRNILMSLLAYLKSSESEKNPTIIENLAISSLAGITAKTIVYPLDLSRKRLQIQGFHYGRKGFGENFSCKGMIHSLYMTVINEGVVALYKGFVPSVIKAAISTALHFTSYDIICQYLATLNTHK